MIYIGTSGYSYEDWKGRFYDANITKGEMLETYAKSFNFTEINSTYYSMPNKFMFFNLAKKTPEDFKFTVKLHRSMTHSRDASKIDYSNFLEALKPLIDTNKFGCVLAQFPYSFKNISVNIDYICRLKENIESIPLCVEFRNSSWSNVDVYKKLAREEIGFVCVDEPDINGLVKKSSIATSRIGYIRFHGRNREKWYDHKEAYERYDYLYTESMLKEWLPRIDFIKNHTDDIFIAFNNHFQGQAAQNAFMMQSLLL